ncbi:MAG TPA: alpha/beta fold hydrolase [Flavobacteriaceae bacterium]|nr:alpha/beta fold hydrolase [Flavobacteriaceae bacterium]
MKLHSVIIGKGKPFLILHGFLGMGDNWKTIGRKISQEEYQVHLIDQRNHGRSPHSDVFSYSAMAKDILEYCHDNNLKEIVLMGHSMGGKTAMFFATENPTRVEKLIVVDIATKYYPPHHQTILKGLSFVNSQKITSREKADEHLSRYVSEPDVRQFLLKNLYWKTKDELSLRLNLEVLNKKLEAVSEPLPQEKIFSKETLFIKGEKSGYLLEKDQVEIRKHFPNFELVMVESAGHWVHAENPNGFFEKLTDFL